MISIKKPKNDDRIFKYTVLKNNIKCIFINDMTLDKTIITTCVNVGSLCDKDYYEGIAHLIEHLCFITSKKYNQVNYLQSKIKEAGGESNAFTSLLQTIYYLDIYDDHIENIIEIFVNHLINADFKKEYINKEISNVDAEHKKNIFNDDWKILNILRLLANKNNNYRHFSTGTNETLKNSDILDKLIHFYNKYYVANNISICIASKKSINQLYEIINNYYGTIPSTGKVNKVKLNKPLYSNNYGNTYHIKISGKDKKLIFIIEIPITYYIIIFYLFAKFLNSNFKNSCKHYLWVNNYIYNMHTYTDDETGLLYIELYLTDFGNNNINFIKEYLNKYINTVLKFNWYQIYDYYKKNSKFNLNHDTKNDTLSTCIYLLKNINITIDPKNLYIDKLLYLNLTNDEIKLLDKYINLDKSIIIYCNSNFKYDKYLIDPYYNTHYKQINLIQKIELKGNIKINFQTKNIYSDVKPKFIDNIKTDIPYLIDENVWFFNVSKFKDTTFIADIIFNNHTFFYTPYNTLLTMISVMLLNRYLYYELYEPMIYGFSTDINLIPKKNSLSLCITAYNDKDKIKLFFKKVFDLLYNDDLNINNTMINNIIKHIKNQLYNYENISPWELSDYYFSMNYDNTYSYKVLIDTLKTININNVLQYIKNLFNDCNVSILFFGNIHKKDLPNYHFLLNKTTQKNYIKMSYNNINIIHPNKKELSNCLCIIYYIGKFEPKKNILATVFIKLFCDLFFKDLRTVNNLGYLVNMSYDIQNNNYYIKQKVQSIYDIKIIMKYIKHFNDNIINVLKDIDLTIILKTTEQSLKENLTTINEIYLKFYNDIIYNNYLFDINNILLHNLKYVNNYSLIKFVKKYILDNKNIQIIKINKHKNKNKT